MANEQDTDTAFGIERTLSWSSIGSMGLRAGYAQGSRGYQMLASGASFSFRWIHLDYAFTFPIGNLSQTQGDHQVSLSFRWGTPEEAPRTLGQKPASQEIREASSLKQPTKQQGLSLPDDFNKAVGIYFSRKAAGASATERLRLLQELYVKFEHNGLDTTLIGKELSSL
jgi:hypothetical protein